MGEIIDFDKKVIERTIKKQKNSITIYGCNAKICIFLNEKMRFRRKKVCVISEEEAKQIFLRDMGHISCRGNLENLWDAIKDELINSSNFLYFTIIGDIKDYKKPFTLSGSVIFSVKNISNKKSKR